MTELEDIKVLRTELQAMVDGAGGYNKAAEELSCKTNTFTGTFLSMVLKGHRGVSTKLAKALGYERVVMYWRK